MLKYKWTGNPHKDINAHVGVCMSQIVKECNEGVRKMSRTEELISIEKTLEFKSKVLKCKRSQMIHCKYVVS